MRKDLATGNRNRRAVFRGELGYRLIVGAGGGDEDEAGEGHGLQILRTYSQGKARADLALKKGTSLNFVC